MYYLLYEITNLINGKTYIGQHTTKDLNDGYMGSGRAILRALKKYGKENFKKKILIYAKNEVALNFFEKALVTPEFCELETNYNLREGGDNNGRLSEETRKKMSLAKTGKKRPPLSLEHKLKIGRANKGKKRAPENIQRMLETKRKNGTTGKGKKRGPRSPEVVAKIWEIRRKNGTTGKGRKLSFEHKLKLSQIRKGIKLPPLSAEHKLKISLAQKGKKKSSEQVAKMKETKRKNREQKLLLKTL